MYTLNKKLIKLTGVFVTGVLIRDTFYTGVLIKDTPLTGKKDILYIGFPITGTSNPGMP